MPKRFSWELASCGVNGHVTYRPDETPLADRLRVASPWGDAWRCLRCGGYVLGDPNGSGPADEAPLVLRGRALQDAFILRLLSVDKGLRGIFLVILGYGIWRFDGARSALQSVFDAFLPALAPAADMLGVRLTDLAAIHWIETAFQAQHTTLIALAAGVAGYGLLQLVESVGLWLMRRWGEYVAAVGTSLFLPLEIYELIEKVTVFRILALVVNLFLVAYLVVSKRLFGVRGGRASHERERHTESLLEVEQAAASAALPRRTGRARNSAVTRPPTPTP